MKNVLACIDCIMSEKIIRALEYTKYLSTLLCMQVNSSGVSDIKGGE